MPHREPSLVQPRYGTNMDKRRPRLLPPTENDVLEELLRRAAQREEGLRDTLRHLRIELLSGTTRDRLVQQINAALC